MINYIDVDGVLVDRDLDHIEFECKYTVCQGDCCRGESDLGAPVYFEELEAWSSHIIDDLLELLPDDSVEAIKKTEGLTRYNGKFYTIVKKGGDCVFLSFNHEFPGCAFEILHSSGKSTFKKPLSCSLFPLRVYEFEGKETLEFKFYPECSSALSTHTKITDFLEGPIIEKFGEDWFTKMKQIFIENTSSL